MTENFTLNETNVQKCRQRAGSAANDRPDSIDDVLDRDKLGYNDGQPLAADSYDEYPNYQDLASPEYEDMLTCLAKHDRVSNASDIVSEFCGASHTPLLEDWLQAVEKALDLFSINITEATEQNDLLSEVLNYQPAAVFVENASPMLIAELYICGLSTSEIEDVFESTETHITERQVRDKLREIGLLAGKTQSEQTEDGRENYWRGATPAVEPMDPE